MEQLNQQADELINLLTNIMKNFRTYISTQVNNFDCDMTVPQLMVIKTLYNHPNISLKDLSEHIGLAKSTTCGIVDRLVQKDMIVRTVDPDDRRNIILTLNPQTNEYHGSINVIKSNFIAGLLKELNASEVEEIVHSLRKLNTLVEKHTID